MRPFIKILLGVIAASLCGAAFYFIVINRSFSEQNHFYVTFDQVDGLTESNPVMVNGYKIGEVLDIDLSEDGTNSLYVKIGVNKDVDVLEGTSASLESSILGDMSIELHLKNSGDPLQNNAELPVHEINNIFIVLEEQAKPSILKADELLKNFEKTSGAIDTNEFNQMRDDLSASVKQIHRIANDVTFMIKKLKLDSKKTGDGVDSLMTSGQSMYTNEYVPFMNKVNAINNRIAALSLTPVKNSAQDLGINLRITANILNEHDNTIGRLINTTDLQDAIARDTAHVSDFLKHYNAKPKHFKRL